MKYKKIAIKAVELLYKILLSDKNERNRASAEIEALDFLGKINAKEFIKK